jgi:membrane protease YdiL (CAAX protease family)
MTTTSERAGGAASMLTAGGLAVFAAAYGWLVLTGTSEVTASSDPGASGVSLLGAFLPALVAVVIALVVPPHALPTVLAGVPAHRLRREVLVLVGMAVAFPLVVLLVPDDLAYPLLKIGLLLVVPLVAFRLLRGSGPAARTAPRPLVWAAPCAAALAWFLTSQVGPLAAPLTQALPDPGTLAVVSLVTLLTAGVLEEVFYRAWLQTRLERADRCRTGRRRAGAAVHRHARRAHRGPPGRARDGSGGRTRRPRVVRADAGRAVGPLPQHLGDRRDPHHDQPGLRRPAVRLTVGEHRGGQHVPADAPPAVHDLLDEDERGGPRPLPVDPHVELGRLLDDVLLLRRRDGAGGDLEVGERHGDLLVVQSWSVRAM